jgi:secondary thiamine-phosphate synthase enzyme
MRKTIHVTTTSREGLYDITDLVRDVVAQSNVGEGIVQIYVRGATAGIMIQEKLDESVQTDVVELLRKLVPRGVWEHDRQDDNGDAHLKSGLIGPSETVPIEDGELLLSTWQNIFLCEFDGPRERRDVVLTVWATSP